MKTPLALMLILCNLSIPEASKYLGIPRYTLASWSCGRNPTPDHVLESLRDLYQDLHRAFTDAAQMTEPAGWDKIPQGARDVARAIVVLCAPSGEMDAYLALFADPTPCAKNNP